ncbi:hypothetical protein LPTSP4_31140 [Leptospira ryugenii]|uniref:Uncharacterized protein n=1 Tax=Leptospira ryugenii TaxID=1917863 RepID=A0A2P2E409_9LEPT|nr:hypothetical protein [Leptospira ryugenii]GBF51576.1 hypothetical protein LPTSP4_31140 [Leptospira ryugenii]
MRIPKYLYLRNRFILPIKIGAFLSLLLAFSSLESQSYSGNFLDDWTANQNHGAVSAPFQSRRQGLANPIALGLQSQSEIYLGSTFRSQKGGNQSDQAANNQITALSSAATAIGYHFENQSFGVFLGPRLSAYRDESFSTRKSSSWDAEGLLDYQFKKGNFKISIEGGRAWQRLDQFGFVFVGMANYSQVLFAFGNYASISLVSQRFKPEEESLSPSAWNSKANQIYGGNIQIPNLIFWESISLFHYQYREPERTAEDTGLSRPRTFGFFRYYGLELRSVSFWEKTRVDLAMIRLVGERVQSTSPVSFVEQSTNAYLAYTSLHTEWDAFFFSLAGLITSKDRNQRRDRESNGYAAPLGEPRVLGGYSSFLLFQSVQFSNDRIFYDRFSQRQAGFENRGIQMFGLQIGKEWSFGYRTDFFLNRSQSELGLGHEMIFKLGRNISWFQNGFVSASACYAWVDPQRTITWLIEPFTTQEAKKEFVRFYVSVGFAL